MASGATTCCGVCSRASGHNIVVVPDSIDPLRQLEWRLGTMGFSYSDWAGVFYPKGIKAGDWLSFYARHFNAVELDTTFYAVPPIERVQRWRDETPEDFRFTAKTPNLITHEPNIDRAAPSMREFLEVMKHFEQKLAVVLLQFPPSFTTREMGRLRKFLERLPRDLGEVRFAAEFRNPTWFATHDTGELLAEHGIAWAVADYAGEPRALVSTTDFLYIRWIGQHQRFNEMDHEQLDVTERLLWWKDQIRQCTRTVKRVYGFFNNDFAGYSVGTCNRFKQIVGEDVIEVKDPRQGELF